MFIPNKYYKWYVNLIQTAQSKSRSKKNGAFDSHHIIPKSLGGSNEKTNLVLLTHREHYIAHMLLVRCVYSAYTYKMISALIRFKEQALTSRKYEVFRATVSKYSKGEYNASYGKIWCHMKDDIENIIYIKKEDFDPITMNKGLPYQRGGNHNKKWIKRGNEQLSISPNELEKYLNEGWTLGRNTSMGKDHMQQMAKIRHSKEKDLAHSAKMREYHKNNPRKGKKAWITNGTENKLIALEELLNYTNQSWRRGRYK